MESVALDDIPVLEWRHAGHRLGYVAAIARAADAEGRHVVLHTSSESRRSEQFAVHLEGLGNLSTRLVTPPAGPKEFARLVAGVGESGGPGPIIPEADEFLHVLAGLGVLGRLRAPTTAVVMRPPGSHDRSKLRFKTLTKATALQLSRLTTEPRLHLLEDPLAVAEEDLVWPSWLRNTGRALKDPPDLYPADSRLPLPPELTNRPRRPYLAVIGAIDERKRIPLLLEGWRESDAKHSADLVVAGLQHESVRAAIASASRADESILPIDRYLSNEEIGSLMANANALIALYDVGTSSGLLTSAGASGSWLITVEGTRTGRVVLANGFGITTSAEPRAIARAMTRAAQIVDRPAPLTSTTMLDFGLQLIEDHLGTTG